MKTLKVAQEEGLEVIFAGDFNDEPDSEPVIKMSQSYDNAIKAVREQTGTDIDTGYTTAKYREKEGMTVRTIDYQFINKPETTSNFDNRITSIGGYQLLPAKASLPEWGFPSKHHPSDHLPLGFQYNFSQSKSSST